LAAKYSSRRSENIKRTRNVTSTKLTQMLTDLDDYIFHPKGRWSEVNKADIERIKREDATNPLPPLKAVIFSQWTHMLDLIEESLIDYLGDYNYVRFDGKMNQKKRQEALEKFNRDDEFRVILVSLKAGGVGLNLNIASVVILMDPWWNQSTEDQAIDRVHRLGQRRSEIIIRRYIVRDTVEENMLLIQEKKRKISATALCSNGSEEKDKLSIDDLIGFFSF